MAVKILAPKFKRNGKIVFAVGTSGKRDKYTHVVDAETGREGRIKTAHFNRVPVEATRFAPANPKAGYTRVRSAKTEVTISDALADLVIA